jgi:hypothetical protein
MMIAAFGPNNASHQAMLFAAGRAREMEFWLETAARAIWIRPGLVHEEDKEPASRWLRPEVKPALPSRDAHWNYLAASRLAVSPSRTPFTAPTFTATTDTTAVISVTGISSHILQLLYPNGETSDLHLLPTSTATTDLYY